MTCLTCRADRAGPRLLSALAFLFFGGAALAAPAIDPKNYPKCEAGESKKCSIGDAGWTFTQPAGLPKKEPQPGATVWLWSKESPGKSMTGLDVSKQMAVLQVTLEDCGDEFLADFCKKTQQDAKGEMVQEKHQGKDAFKLSCEKGVRVQDYLFIRIKPKKCITLNVGYNTEEAKGVAEVAFEEVRASLVPPGGKAATEGAPPVVLGEPPASTGTAAGAEPEKAPVDEAPKPRRVSTVKIPREGAGWSPISVRKAGDPESIITQAVLRIIRTKVRAPDEEAPPPAEGEEPPPPPPPKYIFKEKGRPTVAKAVARSYKAGEDRLLVISIYPLSLKAARTHFELHAKIVEGYLDGVEFKAIRRPGKFDKKDFEGDSFTLRKLGEEFVEEGPSGAKLVVAAMEAKPGRLSLNAGSVTGAGFGAKDLGLVNLTYQAAGVSEGRR